MRICAQVQHLSCPSAHPLEGTHGLSSQGPRPVPTTGLFPAGDLALCPQEQESSSPRGPPSSQRLWHCPLAALAFLSLPPLGDGGKTRRRGGVPKRKSSREGQLAVQPLSSSVTSDMGLTSLDLSFLICKMGITVPPPPGQFQDE